MSTESLTIQIQGDTTGLSTALDEALSRVQNLQSGAESAGAAAEGIGGRLATVSSALQPLTLVGQALTRVSQLAAAIGQQPVTLNVQPALSALQSLMSALQAVSAQLQTLAVPGAGFPIGGGLSGGSSGGSSPRTAAASAFPLSAAGRPMLSSGPNSTGSSASPQVRMAAPLSALALSLVAPLSSALPVPQSRSNSVQRTLLANETRTVSSLATYREQRTTELTPTENPTASSPVVNHFGGITIAVRETADVNALMRDLRLQGLALRHRQG